MAPTDKVRVRFTDADTGVELWDSAQCARHIHVKPDTWRQYSAHHRAPQPVAHVSRVALWNSDEVKHWHANRPRPRNN